MNVTDIAAITNPTICAAPRQYTLLDSPVAKFANHPSDKVVESVPDPELDPDPDPSIVSGESLVAFELHSNIKSCKLVIIHMLIDITNDTHKLIPKLA